MHLPTVDDWATDPETATIDQLLRDHLDLMEASVGEDTSLTPAAREELLQLIGQQREILVTDDLFKLARWVHRMAFELFSRPEATVRHRWARRWLFLDLHIESCLRENGFQREASSIYPPPGFPHIAV